MLKNIFILLTGQFGWKQQDCDGGHAKPVRRQLRGNTVHVTIRRPCQAHRATCCGQRGSQCAHHTRTERGGGRPQEAVRSGTGRGRHQSIINIMVTAFLIYTNLLSELTVLHIFECMKSM